MLKREGGERDRAHRGAFVDQKGTDRTCLKYYCSIDQISSAYYYLRLDPSTTLGAYSVATVHPVHAKTLHIGQAVVTQLHPWPLIARFLLPRLYNIYYLAVPPPAEIFLSHIIASFISTFFLQSLFLRPNPNTFLDELYRIILLFSLPIDTHITRKHIHTK